MRTIYRCALTAVFSLLACSLWPVKGAEEMDKAAAEVAPDMADAENKDANGEEPLTAADVRGPDGIVYPDFSRVGIPGCVPDVPVAVNASEFGAIPNDDKDDAASIQAAVLVAQSRGGGAVLLDPGDYIIDQTITLSAGGIVIRGADRERTRLIPRFAGKDVSSTKRSSAVIEIKPEKIRRRYDVWPDQPIRRGDDSVHLPDKDNGHVKVGDVVALTAIPPSDVINTLAPNLKKQTLDGSYGSIYSWQFLQVSAVDGNIVTFDRPIRLDVAMDQKPKIMHAPAWVEGCGVENLTITQSVESPGIHGITLSETRGCWVRGVTIRKIGNWPFSVSRSWQFEVRDCDFDESLSRGGAVAYVGFGFACDGLIENCRFTRLRHLSISMASNGLVFRNCFLENIDINFHLNWPYEVLFENCRVDSGLGANPAEGEESRGSYKWGIYTPRLDGDMHCPAGPRLTFYHNDIASPHDGIMLGGGATKNTVVAYNRFNVDGGFGAVIRRGSEDSMFHKNAFVLHDPGKRKRWMMKEAYGTADPESVTGAVFFPHGAPDGIAFTENTFRVPREIPLFAGGDPAIENGNTMVPAVAEAKTVERVSLSGEWQGKALDLRQAAAKVGDYPDEGPSEEAKRLLAGNVGDGWSTVSVPGLLDSAPINLSKQDGEVVLRRRFDMPQELLGKALTLSLGPIDDHDETWVNGVKVGATSGKDAWKTPRLYTVPAELLKPTGNVIVIRVWDAFGGGGFSGQQRDLWIGILPKKVVLDLGAMPEPPVPSLYEWQIKNAEQKGEN